MAKKSGEWDQAALRKAIRSSAMSELKRTGDPEYLAEVVAAANAAGNREAVDEALDAYNSGKR